MKIGDKVKFINNEGLVDDCICEIVEIKKDHVRIKKPNGDIIRIYHDRIVSDISSKKEIEVKKEESKEAIEFDPFDDLPTGHEVWIKGNTFCDTVICSTYAIIDPNSTNYLSINTYNGVVPKKMVYAMKNYKELINRLQKKGYRLSKPENK